MSKAKFQLVINCNGRKYSTARGAAKALADGAVWSIYPLGWDISVAEIDRRNDKRAAMRKRAVRRYIKFCMDAGMAY